MRIAFVGKGGSGKTTLSSLFCRYLSDLGLPVLAIDADINQHLGVALGMTEAEAAAMPALGLGIAGLKEYLRGDNVRISSVDDMMKTTPPGQGSRLIRFGEENPVLGRFIVGIGTIRLMATGPFDEDDIGVKCYHSKTGSAELLLNHLIDGKGEYVVVDMTAGADSFASGLFTKFDLTAMVVEPTRKSLSVYEQYRRYAANHDVRLVVVGNKIESWEDVRFLEREVGRDLLACLWRSPFVKSEERAGALPITSLEVEGRAALAALAVALDRCPKDWSKFVRQSAEFHKKNAVSWANVSVGKDLRAQIDPRFAFPSH